MHDSSVLKTQQTIWKVRGGGIWSDVKKGLKSSEQIRIPNTMRGLLLHAFNRVPEHLLCVLLHFQYPSPVLPWSSQTQIAKENFSKAKGGRTWKQRNWNLIKGRRPRWARAPFRDGQGCTASGRNTEKRKGEGLVTVECQTSKILSSLWVRNVHMPSARQRGIYFVAASDLPPFLSLLIHDVSCFRSANVSIISYLCSSITATYCTSYLKCVRATKTTNLSYFWAIVSELPTPSPLSFRITG